MPAPRSELHHPATVLRWVHAPQQARTRESLTRLLDAAAELIAERGIDEASIIDIAQRAGSSVGGFYRRFRDKDRMVQALHERFCADARATADDALTPTRWAGATLVDVLHEFVAFLAEIYREREGLLRAFLQYSLVDASMRERTLGLFSHLSQRLSMLLATRRHEVSHPHPELAASFGLQMVFGTLNHSIQMRQGPLPIDDQRLVAELSRAFAAYLGAEPPKRKLQLSPRRNPS